VSVSSGDHTPLWLNANKYGLSSLEKSNGYLRASLERPQTVDSARKWGISYGLDMAVAYNYTSTLIIQKAYGEVRWLKGALTVGAKEWPMEMKNPQLSTGSQTLGINARPVPQVRLALQEYWTIPVLWRLFAIKGHISYGMLTDGRWQHGFVGDNGKRTDKTLYHSKAVLFRVGKPQKFPLWAELGIEAACTFGGTVHKNGSAEKMPEDLNSFAKALVFGKDNVDTGVYSNVAGNQLGSWVGRINYDHRLFQLGLYYDHFFDDHSQLGFFDYDGYGSGENWKVKETNKFHGYKLKDMMLGLEAKLKNFPYVNNIVLEYLYTKYQSGPFLHDHTSNIPDHIAGNDDYYNHYMYAAGWSHWGQVMGNPLYLSPIYSDDGTLYIGNNRFVAWHLGLSGQVTKDLSYRALMTYQKGWGTDDHPYIPRRRGLSVLLEATYSLPETFLDGGWAVKLGLGADKGKIYGDNYGCQLTISKSGTIR